MKLHVRWKETEAYLGRDNNEWIWTTRASASPFYSETKAQAAFTETKSGDVRNMEIVPADEAV